MNAVKPWSPGEEAQWRYLLNDQQPEAFEDLQGPSSGGAIHGLAKSVDSTNELPPEVFLAVPMGFNNPLSIG